jgi:hypothetical protein
MRYHSVVLARTMKHLCPLGWDLDLAYYDNRVCGELKIVSLAHAIHPYIDSLVFMGLGFHPRLSNHIP